MRKIQQGVESDLICTLLGCLGGGGIIFKHVNITKTKLAKKQVSKDLITEESI